MTISPTFDRIFRHRVPGLYGRPCRIVATAMLQRDKFGSLIHHTGEEPAYIEFEDGTRLVAERQAVIDKGSKLARQIVAKLKREARI